MEREREREIKWKAASNVIYNEYQLAVNTRDVIEANPACKRILLIVILASTQELPPCTPTITAMGDRRSYRGSVPFSRAPKRLPPHTIWKPQRVIIGK